jgi:hypothetical protein
MLIQLSMRYPAYSGQYKSPGLTIPAMERQPSLCDTPDNGRPTHEAGDWLRLQKSARRIARGPGKYRENPPDARKNPEAPQHDGTVHYPVFFIRPDRSVPEQRAEQHQLERDGVGQALRFIERVAEGHKPHLHGDAEFTEHCKYPLKDI